MLHFVGFAVFGILVVWRLAGLTGTISIWTLAGWLAGLLGYAAFDEVTQMWVGRSCEFLDWVADGVGAVAGMAIAVVCHRLTLLRGAGENPDASGE